MADTINKDNPDDIDNRANQRGILIDTNPKVATFIEKEIKKVREGKKRKESTEPDERLSVRKSLIESDKSDPNGFERIIGTSELVSVNFMARGLKAAAAVCRIRVPTQGGEWYGTGFLVGPRLLMTNNHVLASPEEAAQTEAEFNYEHDADGVLNPPIQFNLAPHEIFFTDSVNDVTFVAVAAYSEGGIPLERFGYLPLLALSGKGIEGEWVTIIQHPAGQPKQMTIQASQIVELDQKKFPDLSERFIHYTTDTEPGSSGSPVLNDQWQVVAIHHKAIPNPAWTKEAEAKSGTSQWLANEGVRISAIFKLLEGKRFSDLNTSRVLERLSRSIGMRPLQVWETTEFDLVTTEAERKPLPAKHWKGPKLGYDLKFLPVDLPLTKILGDRRKDAAKLINSNEVILDYLHFSVVIDRKRKFPMLTAVNIHGAKLKHPGARSDSWRRDIRMEDQYQPGDNFYVKSKGKDKVAFSRGHLVRRFDPCWGDTLKESQTAEMHTFHFSNAAPQVQGYNNKEWGDLEDYILDRTQTLERKVTVFTGPIFNKFDPEYGIDREGGPWQIPVSFWKIAVIEKTNGEISAAAFMIGQLEYIQALYEAKVFSGLNPYSFSDLQTRKIQTTIKTVENETGFNFSALRKFDTQDALESTRQTRYITQNSEIMI
jgi:endonuclease G